MSEETKQKLVEAFAKVGEELLELDTPGTVLGIKKREDSLGKLNLPRRKGKVRFLYH